MIIDIFKFKPTGTGGPAFLLQSVL